MVYSDVSPLEVVPLILVILGSMSRHGKLRVYDYELDVRTKVSRLYLQTSDKALGRSWLHDCMQSLEAKSPSQHELCEPLRLEPCNVHFSTGTLGEQGPGSTSSCRSNDKSHYVFFMALTPTLYFQQGTSPVPSWLRQTHRSVLRGLATFLERRGREEFVRKTEHKAGATPRTFERSRELSRIENILWGFIPILYRKLENPHRVLSPLLDPLVIACRKDISIRLEINLLEAYPPASRREIISYMPPRSDEILP
ncbi:hypothetical protein VNO77_44247 [Canavalia gladiata]|uniref:Uncharacterized protein n=1 Tax=Canavalia gladiata TaxID=3824 RepID=A0AAN9PQU3_CANGL